MVKKIFYKNGIMYVSDSKLSLKQCYYMINHYDKHKKQKDYLLEYYKDKGFEY